MVDEAPEKADVLAECLVAVLVHLWVGAGDRQPRDVREELMRQGFENIITFREMIDMVEL